LRRAPPFQPAATFFALCVQSVAVAIPPAHDVLGKFRLRGAQPASALWRCVLIFTMSTKEAAALDLTLKLNVLVVCAVFAFVGAVLLGAF
jgi:hypothetical protein